MERMDKLRRRPQVVRYFFLAESGDGLHTGASYWGLLSAHRKHVIKGLYVADVITGRTFQVPMPVERFLDKWREHYNDPSWDYYDEIAKKGASIDGKSECE